MTVIKDSSKGTKAEAYKIGTKTQKFLDDCKMCGMEVTLPKKYNTWFCSELNIPITDPVVDARSKLVEEFKTDSTDPRLLKNMRTDSAKAKVDYFIDYLLYHMGTSFSKITNATPNTNGTCDFVEFIGITIGNTARTFKHTHEHYKCSMSRGSAKRVLEALKKLEYVRIQLGKKNPTKKHGNPTALAPMTKLLDLLVQYKVITNTLSHETKTPLIYTKLEDDSITEVTNDKAEVILIEQNRLIASTVIDLPVDTFNEYVDCYSKAYVSGGLIRRIYSKELDQSGRFYHGYSGCPSKYRKMITFDGEPTVELDYQASQVHVAYSMNGVNAWDYIDGDPYIPPNADPKHRSVYKALLIRSFTIANPIRSVKDDKDIKTNGLNLTEMLDEIWQMHRHISNHRNKEAYKTVAFEESRVALKVIELCNEQGIAVLPIHDSTIAKKQHMQTLKEMMVRAYELLGFVSVPGVTED
jgi:predicted RNA-binding protein with PUA domain